MENNNQQFLEPILHPKISLQAALIIGAAVISGSILYSAILINNSLNNSMTRNISAETSNGGAQVSGGPADEQIAALEEKVLPAQGVTLPVQWGDLGAQMISAGIIDEQKFTELYASRGGLDEESKKLLSGNDNGYLVMTLENSQILLNLLWAVGLGNKNVIMDGGPMSDKSNGGAGNFASTGGWSLAAGDAMDHFSKHQLLILTAEQQSLVEDMAKNIYRPCCGNSTYFPDCNHGMAMLGLLELMASQGVSEVDMYKAALAVNSYWFPDTYLTIAKFLDGKEIAWEAANPKSILAEEFSSAQGYQEVRSQVEPVETKSSGGCGV